MKILSSRRLLAAFALAAALSPPRRPRRSTSTSPRRSPPRRRRRRRSRELCQRACLGNQRKSWLESAIVHADTGGSSVTVLLKLRSKHAAHGVTIYEETATVRVDADLSLAGCGITNVRATSNNDLYRALLRAFAPQIRDAVRRHGRFC